MAEPIEQKSKHYLAKSVEEALEELSVDREKGLSDSEVHNRKEQYGPNELPKKEGASPVKLFFKQFKDFLILILFLAAGISVYAGQMANAYIILGVILFNAIMGFIQEYRAEKAVESIKNIVKQKATVLRGGERKTIVAKALVPGDIVLLEEGQTIPADCRLIEVKNLRTAEATLTGESEPVAKQTDTVKKDADLIDRTNMVWKGTHVVKGSGQAVVTATGKETEIGKIASSLSEMDQAESNFRKKTARLAKKMAAIAVCTSIVVFCLGYFYRDFAFNEILLVTIATMVSSIPEGLPVVISIVLAIGANRMAQRNAIIREFTATEVLGSVSTILTDKTGTITQSVLTVKKLVGADQAEMQVSGQGYQLGGKIQQEEDEEEVQVGSDQPILTKLLLIAAYCNQATIKEKDAEQSSFEDQDTGQSSEKPEHSEEGPEPTEEDESEETEKLEVSGDPTEIALRVLAEKSSLKELEGYQEVEVLDDIPFNSEQKFRATLIQYNSTKEMLVVGAPEKILELSEQWLMKEKPEQLSGEDREFIQHQNDEWASEALRVLALAYREMPEDQNQIEEEDVQELTWSGLVGMIDPPRPEVKEALAECRDAGIRVIMVTGDHKKTAAAIAKDVGIIQSENGEQDYPDALSESELDDLNEEEFDDTVAHVSVFARVSPTPNFASPNAYKKKAN